MHTLVPVCPIFRPHWPCLLFAPTMWESSQLMRSAYTMYPIKCAHGFVVLGAYNTYPRKLPPDFVMLWIAALQVLQRIWVWSPQYQWKSPQEYGWNLQVSYNNKSRQGANRVHNSWTYCISLSETICDLRKYRENRPRTHLISVNNIHFT